MLQRLRTTLIFFRWFADVPARRHRAASDGYQRWWDLPDQRRQLRGGTNGTTYAPMTNPGRRQVSAYSLPAAANEGTANRMLLLCLDNGRVCSKPMTSRRNLPCGELHSSM